MPGIRPVIRDHQPEGPAIHVPVSCCLSAAGIRFSVIRFPPRNSALLTVGLPGKTFCPDLDGVTAFRTHELRPGWVPPITRGQVVLAQPGRLPARHPPLPSGQSLKPRRNIPPREALLHGPSTGVHSRSPVRSSPRPRPRDGTSGRFGAPPELRTPPSPAAHVRSGDRPSSTDLELPLNSHPSTSNPVVHSTRATSRRTANRRARPIAAKRPLAARMRDRASLQPHVVVRTRR
jgi:hypothetical protein